MKPKLLNLKNVNEDELNRILNHLESKYFHPLDYDYDKKNLMLKIYNTKILDDKSIRELIIECLV